MDKTQKCMQIFCKYGLLIDYLGSAKNGIGKGKTDDETLCAWATRVLGTNITGLVVYQPVEFAGNKRIKTLKQETRLAHIRRLFRQVSENKDDEHNQELHEMSDKFSTLPKETLIDLIDEKTEHIEPETKEFFERLAEKSNEDITVNELIEKLMDAFNNVVLLHKKSTTKNTTPL